MQKQILESVHAIEAGFGRVANRFIWTSMYQDIDEYIKTCEKSQRYIAIKISENVDIPRIGMSHTNFVQVYIIANILFRNNTSHRGGAIHLFKSKIGLRKIVSI